MVIFPAIDLKDGVAVRLTKGLMESAKIYSNSPAELGAKFESYGAEWLHLVDLNGAFSGNTDNLKAVEEICKNTKLKIELGGGIRDEATIEKYLSIGVTRVILGTVAAKNPEFVKTVAKKYRVAVGIDAIDGMVAVEGWAKVSEIKATDLAKAYADSGVEAIIATDVSRDGMLGGVNIDFCADIANSSKLFTIASGGVAGIDDIKNLKANGTIGGVIVGKAYYEGRLDLAEAIKFSNE